MGAPWARLTAAPGVREESVTVGVTWVFVTDTAIAGFLESAGWGPDAAERTLEADGSVVQQRRWHTAL